MTAFDPWGNIVRHQFTTWLGGTVCALCWNPAVHPAHQPKRKPITVKAVKHR